MPPTTVESRGGASSAIPALHLSEYATVSFSEAYERLDAADVGTWLQEAADEAWRSITQGTEAEVDAGRLVLSVLSPLARATRDTASLDARWQLGDAASPWTSGRLLLSLHFVQGGDDAITELSGAAQPDAREEAGGDPEDERHHAGAALRELLEQIAERLQRKS
jgi:hypothetical protein